MKAVFWDIDGTLVDSEPVHFAIFMEMCEAHGISAAGIDYDDLVGVPAKEIFGWILSRFRPGTTVEQLFAEKVARYQEKGASLSARPQALDVWRRIDAGGVCQGVVSNADRLICQVNLAAIGLSRPGLITVSRNDVREGKPDPEPYLRGAYLAGASPKDCVAVEDSAVGARAALAAGMTTVFWPQDEGQEAPDGCLAVRDLAAVDWDGLLA